jgi:hypothetical protein
LYLTDRIERDPCISRHGCDVAVAEQVLNHADIDAAFQQMRRKAVPQRVNGKALSSPAPMK